MLGGVLRRRWVRNARRQARCSGRWSPIQLRQCGYSPRVWPHHRPRGVRLRERRCFGRPAARRQYRRHEGRGSAVNRWQSPKCGSRGVTRSGRLRFPAIATGGAAYARSTRTDVKRSKVPPGVRRPPASMPVARQLVGTHAIASGRRGLGTPLFPCNGAIRKLLNVCGGGPHLSNPCQKESQSCNSQ